ncbi:hypothetical protein [Cytophaga aurantiaca]|nr:hypothetical protein [Cytophaga aurantiaca]
MKTKQIILSLCILLFLGASCVRASKSCKNDYKKVRKNNSSWKK